MEQTLDTHGNPTQTRIYNWNSLSTPARTYTQAYLHASPSYPQYAPQRIFDRVMSSTVAGGGATWQTTINNFDLVNTWMAQSEIDQLRYHDAAYTTNFMVRGNLTTSYQPGTTKNLRYDITGTVRNAWDEKGQVEVTTAAASGFAAPTRITPNGNLNLATNGTYNSFLAPTSVTGPNGAVTGFSYDALARPSGVSSPHGATTVYTYTNGPPATRTATVTVTIPPPPFGQPTTTQRWTRTTYDGLGREVLVESGDSAGTKSIVNTEYGPCACSPLGRVKRVSQPYAPGGTVYWTVYSYDALGRTTRIDHPGGTGATVYLYEGNSVTVTDPAGKWKKYMSDVFGNLVQVTEPAPEGGQHQTYYTYDLFNHLTQVSMPRGAVTQTRTFNYEAGTHRMLSATHPESGTTTYAYNADGTLLSKTTAANRTTTYTYDGLKRVTLAERAWDDCLRTEYYYDTNPFDGAYTQNAWGRIAAVRYFDPVNFVDPQGLNASPIEQFMRCVGAPWDGPWGWRCGGPWGVVASMGGTDWGNAMPGTGRSAPAPDPGGGGGGLQRVGGSALEQLLSIKPESCSIGVTITMECGSGDTSSAAFLFAAAGRPWWAAIATSWWAAAQLVGRAGEARVQEILNMPENFSAIVSKSGNDRIPDFFRVTTNTISLLSKTGRCSLK